MTREGIEKCLFLMNEDGKMRKKKMQGVSGFVVVILSYVILCYVVVVEAWISIDQWASGGYF